MSRRTKIIVTVATLALLGVIGGCLATFWSTRNPLQFRVERYVPAEEGQMDGIAHPRVMNTSSLPVHLYHGMLTRPVTSKSQLEGVGVLDPSLQDRPVKSHAPLLLRPGEAMSCTVTVIEYTDPGMMLANTEMTYLWRSQLTEKLWKLWTASAKDAPEIIQTLLPAGFGLFEHRALVEPAGASQPSP